MNDLHCSLNKPLHRIDASDGFRATSPDQYLVVTRILPILAFGRYPVRILATLKVILPEIYVVPFSPVVFQNSNCKYTAIISFPNPYVHLPVSICAIKSLQLNFSSSSFSSGHLSRPTNDLFRSHDCIRLVVSVMVVQVFFRQVDSQEVVIGI